MGISGFIEVVGLALWGHELFANMRAGKKLEKESGPVKAMSQTLEITPALKVGEVLERYPESLDVFVRRGFTPLRNPVLRRTMARVITIEQACRREGVDMTELLKELNALASMSVQVQPLVSIRRV